ncbi:Zinc finger homeobox protein 3 [Halotydeus destructor]|nr:Zinc finger homeobox protein 3 [Halotydeus destructor]
MDSPSAASTAASTARPPNVAGGTLNSKQNPPSLDTGQSRLEPNVLNSDDAETFTGKIVYNPDGSAYIIEGSDGSDVESEVGSMLPLNQEGSIVDRAGGPPQTNHHHQGSSGNSSCSPPTTSSSSSTNTVSNSAIPQVVSAFHIQKSSTAALQSLYGALYGQNASLALAANQLLKEKVPEVPIMHSYRVFTLRDKDSSASDQAETGDANNNLDETNEATDSTVGQSVPVKPILMCFICKISFGYTKSFVAHATGEHQLCLIEEERRLLSQKNTSAIIQGVGKDKEPLLSFLEPKQKAPQPLLPQSLAGLAANLNQLSVAAASSSGASGAGNGGGGGSGSTSSSSIHQQFQQQLEAAQQRLMAAAQAAAAAALRGPSSLSSSSASAAADNLRESPSRPSSNGSLNLVLPKSNSTNCQDDDDHRSSRGTPAGDDNSLTPELADLANLEKIAKAAAAAIQHHDADNSSSNQLLATSLGQFVSPKGPSQLTQSPFGCPLHPDGRPVGVDCPKCDLLLGSPRSLGGHMTMMHSRNSCKTLKCPKCNWHYKYQETLEIHMKEKHPENEMNCIYCLTNQSHPRLARGETYTCGYKPYRCEVCNYSTTTKGNLSIHMQSDKHINNVQELQNGNIPAEHLLQSQALAQAAAAAAAQQVTSKSQSVRDCSSVPNGSNASSPGIPMEKASPVSVPGGQQLPPSASPVSSSQGKPKATWRCDVCNYETNVARNLRIHMTSEKHTHNMMVLQQNVKHMQQLTALQQAGMLAGSDASMFQLHPGLLAALTGAGGAPPGAGANIPGSENLQPEAALADMAYNHALLMMASQHQQQRAMAAMMQQQAQMQQNQQQQQQQQQQGKASSMAALGTYGQQGAANGQPIVDLDHPDPSLRFDSVPYDDKCRLLQCCVCTGYTCDSIEALSQHIQQDRTRIREDEVLMAVGGSYICKLCSYKTNLKANFQLHCKTDKHLQRLQQVNHIKEGGSRTEWKLKFVNVSNPVQVRCNVCDYYTNSVHKLQLHSASARHEASARVFLHLTLTQNIMKSQMRDAESRGHYFYCSLCQHTTRSKVTLLHHVHSMKHLQQENLRQLKMQQQPHQAKSIEEELRDMFQVRECQAGEQINFDDNESSNPVNSHLFTEDLSGLQSPHGAATPTMDPALAAALGIDTTSMLKQALLEQQAAAAAAGIKSEPRTSPSSEQRFQASHVLKQHSKQQQQVTSAQRASDKQQQMLCPLCQEAFQERARLGSHLADVHNVTKEGVQRLMLIVDQTGGDLLGGLDNKSARVSKGNSDENETDSTGAENADGKSDCGSVDSLRGDDLSSIDQQAAKFLKLGGGVPAAVSDRHVYKYRCNQCSLAFKTMEKLQLHSQYHLIRAATQCFICGRSFRSVESLQKHVESSHQDMTEDELESYKHSLANNPLLTKDRNGGGVLDPATTELLKKESNRLEELVNNEEDVLDLAGHRTSTPFDEPMDTDYSGMTGDNREGEGAGEAGHNSLEDYLNSQPVAEDSYNDPSRKYKCHRCKVAFTRQSYLTSHNKTLLHRKGEKMTYPMEKYLDPNRPYKCDICKESFTQKNILLVHYNSVSHLHKLKQSMKESGSNSNLIQQQVSASNSSDNQPSAGAAAPAAAMAMATTLATTSSPSEAATNNSLSPSAPNGNNCTAASSSSSCSATAADLEKKPFRCNICKVAYNLGATLDIHIRSVLHQTRASKLHDLAISGQIDLSQPLIERPDGDSLASSSSPTSATGNANCKTSQDNNANSETPSPCSTPKATDSFPTGLSIAEQQLQQQLQQHSVALNLANQQLLLGAGNAGVSSGFPCQSCGSVFANQETSIQHQQLCCLFGPSSANALMRSGQQQAGQAQSQQQQQYQSKEDAQLSALRSKFYSAPVCRSKPPVYKHLLETWGFEIVMQFNEHHQKRRRPKEDGDHESEKTGEADVAALAGGKQSVASNSQPGNEISGSEVKTEKTKADSGLEGKYEAGKVDANLPEINRSKCDVCQKEFSSIWVLKAHREEVHKQVVALDVVESFADSYRKEYDRRNSVREVDSGETIEQQQQQQATNSEVSGAQRRPTPAQTPASSDGMLTSASGNNSSVNNHNSSPMNQSQLPGNNVNNSNNPTAQASQNDMNAASQMAAQLQFSQLLMSMGLAGMGMPMGMNMNMNAMPFAAAAAAMGIPPQMMGALMMGQFDPVMAAAMANAHPGSNANGAGQQNASAAAGVPPVTSSPDPSFFAAQQKLLQQQQLAAAQQQKRARTRITDDQLKILRQYFDINNSPTDEHLQEMSEKSGLPLKVIKHWFRNTLFKERQRNKDSPYNFNNPPSTFLNLEEYEKTGDTKLMSLDESQRVAIPSAAADVTDKARDKIVTTGFSSLETNSISNNLVTSVKQEPKDIVNKAESEGTANVRQEVPSAPAQAVDSASKSGNQTGSAAVSAAQPGGKAHRDSLDYAKSFSMSPHSESSMSSISTNDTGSQHAGSQAQQQHAQSASSSHLQFQGMPAAFAGLPSSLGNNALQLAIDAHRSQVSVGHVQNTSNSQCSQGSSSSTPGKRANRTRFTDYQIKVLQEFFESNAYPKDDDLEYLSKLLNLSPRVIVVWFQNARQKARKVYENQPANISEDETSPNRFQRTPGLNYQCKKCMQVFQRYYELIKHQKSACFKDENPLAVQMKAAQEARLNSASPGAASCASNSSNVPDKVTGPPSAAAAATTPANGAFSCEKCSLVFPRFDLWREHQLVHLMNPNLFPNYPPTSPFGILQLEAQQQQQQQQQQAAVAAAAQNSNQMNGAAMTSQNSQAQAVAAAAAAALFGAQGNTGTPVSSLGPQGMKRKLGEDDDSRDSLSPDFNGSQTGSTGTQDTPRDKRLRTTILPEQLDYLYQKYQVESNPSRKMLENIAKEVGLKKRVVQVWFQNTRARERKGQFRAHQQVIHKRCPFCRALFKARSALESHLATRHADQYTKGDINIDALPDGDPSEEVTAPLVAVENALGKQQQQQQQQQMTPEMLQMKQYYENSQFLKKYIDEITGGQGEAALPAEISMNIRAALERGAFGGESAPLDLSKPVDMSRQLPFGRLNIPGDDDGGFDSRSEGESDSESDGGHDESGANSPNPGSTTSSVTSPAAFNANGHGHNSRASSGGSKRYRTQMSTVQIKVMKSIFADYKTPSMAECEGLGRELGLAKRVIQVWFQNARAKEKKARLAFAKNFGHEMPEPLPLSPEECKVCGVKYNLKFSSTSVQDHLFSRLHIENLRTHIDSVKKFVEGPDNDTTDFPGASTIIMPPTQGSTTTTTTPTTNGSTSAIDNYGVENRFSSAANLMQQWQMMGLATGLHGDNCNDDF